MVEEVKEGHQYISFELAGLQHSRCPQHIIWGESVKVVIVKLNSVRFIQKLLERLAHERSSEQLLN